MGSNRHFALKSCATRITCSVGLLLTLACSTGKPNLRPNSESAAKLASSTRPIESTQVHVRFQFSAIRTVAYDGFTLPLVSPDGCAAAVQTSSSVDWQTLLASVEGGVPDAGRISIAPLCGSQTDLLLEVPRNDLLLGRSADAEGFLVESPQLDGSRWIGRVSWQGGNPLWIVEDESVNAFAVLGPNGELAWCHRERHASRFALKVRRGDVTEEIPAPDGGAWLSPSFSSDGRFLFALRLRDGVLAVCAFPTLPEISRSPVTSIDLSWRADERMAYQALVPLRTRGFGVDPRLTFFHPRFNRMAIWNPVTNRVALASAQSTALLQVSPTSVLTSASDRLLLEPAPIDGSSTDAKRTTTIVESLWIPIGIGSSGGVFAVHPRGGSLDLARIDIETGTR